MTKALAANCVLNSTQDNQWLLLASPSQSALINTATVERIANSIKKHLGKDIQLKIDVGNTSQVTPAKKQQQETENKLANAMTTLESDTIIKQLQQTFGAKILKNTIHVKQ